ncbi:MAG: alpha/beta hydrolase [Rhodospirillaceae bacterium]|nr:alpha/beta hydrolase [Rhodospirillaceae bacterium]
MPVLNLSNGTTLNFGDTGAGAPTIVLVHGSPAEGRAWGRVARHLGPNGRLLTPDLPGYGASDPAPSAAAAGTAAMAHPIAALIEQADAPVWVVGHSYGGNVALHAALAKPGRVAGLILFEPVFFRGLDLAGRQRESTAARTHFEDYIRRVESGDHAAVSRMIDFWFGAGACARLPEPVRAYLEKAAPRNAVDVGAALADDTPRDALAAFARPTTIAYGAASPPVVPAIAEALAGLLPQAETVPIADATHGMLDTHPEAVAAIIRRRTAA